MTDSGEIKLLNGNIKWIVPWLTGCLWFVATTTILFMGNSIIQNERRSTDRHVIILEKVSEINTRVSTMEGNRFTSMDANNMMQLILEKLPPKWLVEKVNENKQDINKINSHLNHRKYNE